MICKTYSLETLNPKQLFQGEALRFQIASMQVLQAPDGNEINISTHVKRYTYAAHLARCFVSVVVARRYLYYLDLG